MGKFTEGLTKRVQHTRISSGYCLVCGTYGPLTWDHVQPQGSITVTKIEQMHVMEFLEYQQDKITAITSPNGSKFKTICSKCNSEYIGANDQEICKVFRELTEKVKGFYLGSHNHMPTSVVFVESNSTAFIKAMVGHVLAATTVEECKVAPEESSYYKPLQDFVLNKSLEIASTHDFYCWFYPFSYHLSVKGFFFKNAGHSTYMSLLSFFPLAFLVTKKGEGIYPAHAKKIEITDKYIGVDMSQANVKYSRFPFCELKGDRMMGLRDCVAIVSYPKLS